MMSVSSIISYVFHTYVDEPRLRRLREMEAYMEWAMSVGIWDTSPRAINKIRPELTGMKVEKVNMGAIDYIKGNR